MTRAPRGFASDNYAGAHPAALAAIAAANDGHAGAYGADPWTERMAEAIRAAFGPQAVAYPVFNGTAANVLSLHAVCRPWQAAICTTNAHLHTDECGAPEGVAGLKLLALEAPDAKLTPELAERAVVAVGDEHAVQARVISITQSTELATVYAPEQIRALADYAHENDMLLHVDGARLFNAAAALGVEPRSITTDAGVDLLSLGGTKAGLLGAEAVVFLRDGLNDGFRFLRKQKMQLASKQRYAAAQLTVLLQDELWRATAGAANAAAARLAAAVGDLPGVEITRPVEANGVFAVLDPAVTERLQERWPFYVWNEKTGEVRWMCGWDVTADDVDAFAADVADAVGAPVA
ncbi:MAG TPA: beta-eliminating lyase-related protein [Solirubrobacteraceae bacterium]|jgi:threonine aldolase